MKLKRLHLFIFMVVTDIASLVTGTVLDLTLDRDFYLACGISITAVVTVTGLLFHGIAIEGATRTDAVRNTIACSFLLIYLLLVIYSIFFASNKQPPSPETVTLLNSFTTMATVVFGFYFTAGSVDKYIESRRETSNATNDEKDTTDTAS
jgi:hypothetical protein